ncbi:hypothetical protein ABHB64_24045, partial [Escherichia coli]|nr:hypothetical protein [Escherichia coli]MDB7246694.1 hypothetical protein [Escherichia coli]MDB8034912.1 hypothetical protein [Escherichia coli]
TGSFGPYGCPENLSVRFFPNSAGSPIRGYSISSSNKMGAVHFHIVDNVGFVHAGCGVNALSGMKTLQIQ